jgi:hypothetical protein
MNENFQPSQEPSFSEEVKPMPLIDKISGIFLSPAEVYENLVKSKPRTIDWLVPLAVMIAVVIASTLLKFGNESIRNSLISFQEQRFEQLVEEGKMTEEQAEIARERLSSFGGAQKIFSVVGALIGIPIVFLIVSLVYFLLGRLFFKVDVDFMSVFSIYSLSSFIGTVGVMVATLLSFLTGSFFASASPSIFMEPSTSKLYQLATKFELFSIWQYAVFAIGLAKAFNRSYSSTFALVFGVWLIWIILSLFVPFLG